MKKQSEMDAFHGRKEETPDASNAEGSSVSEDVVCRQKRYRRQSLAPQWFCGFAVLCAREVPTVKPHPLYDLQAHTFS